MAIDNAEFRFKCDELLKIAPYLQCQRCKDVPGPSGAKKFRYTCLNTSHPHLLCEQHKDLCSCGSLVGKKPSEAIAKLLEDWPSLCSNYENGCREIPSCYGYYEYHKTICRFGQVFCLHSYKDGKNCGKKVLLNDFVDHLATFHENKLFLKRDNDKINKWITRFSIDEADSRINQSWFPVQVKDLHGNIFYSVGCFANNTFNFMIYFYGSPKLAKNFSCTCWIGNKAGEKFLYTGQVHSLDETKSDVIASGLLFKVEKNAVMRSLDEDSKLHVEFTIYEKDDKNKDKTEE